MGTRAGDVGVPKAEDCSAAVLSAERERAEHGADQAVDQGRWAIDRVCMGAEAGAGATADMYVRGRCRPDPTSIRTPWQNGSVEQRSGGT